MCTGRGLPQLNLTDTLSVQNLCTPEWATGASEESSSKQLRCDWPSSGAKVISMYSNYTNRRTKEHADTLLRSFIKWCFTWTCCDILHVYSSICKCIRYCNSHYSSFNLCQQCDLFWLKKKVQGFYDWNYFFFSVIVSWFALIGWFKRTCDEGQLDQNSIKWQTELHLRNTCFLVKT